jgi:hypothetical protein
MRPSPLSSLDLATAIPDAFEVIDYGVQVYQRQRPVNV